MDKFPTMTKEQKRLLTIALGDALLKFTQKEYGVTLVEKETGKSAGGREYCFWTVSGLLHDALDSLKKMEDQS